MRSETSRPKKKGKKRAEKNCQLGPLSNNLIFPFVSFAINADNGREIREIREMDKKLDRLCTQT